MWESCFLLLSSLNQNKRSEKRHSSEEKRNSNNNKSKTSRNEKKFNWYIKMRQKSKTIRKRQHSIFSTSDNFCFIKSSNQFIKAYTESCLTLNYRPPKMIYYLTKYRWYWHRLCGNPIIGVQWLKKRKRTRI